MDGLVAELIGGARAEMAVVAERGGAVEAVPYMKTQLVESHRERVRRIEAGELQGGRPERLHRGRALAAAGGRGRRHPARGPGGGALGRRRPRRVARRARPGRRGRGARRAARRGRGSRRRTSCPPRWPPPRRERPRASGPARCARCSASTGRPPAWPSAAAAPSDDALAELRERVERVSEALGRRIKILVGKPGLDGHSNGAEQIAVRARDAGMDVVYEGIRLTPARIARTAVDEGVHVVGLSILSGSHAELIPAVLRELRRGRRRRARGGRRDHPAGRRGAPCSRPAWPASTRRRTSRSAGSWATSWSWWPSTTAPRPRPS